MVNSTITVYVFGAHVAAHPPCVTVLYIFVPSDKQHRVDCSERGADCC